MTERRVRRSGKDRDGDITRLCGDWGSRTKSEAISDIESRIHRYYVEDYLTRRAEVQVVKGPTGKYLRTDPNSSCSDNLDNLPDC